MSSHIPDKGEQMVRYYAYYNNVCRGRRQKENQDGLILMLLNKKRIQKNTGRIRQGSLRRFTLLNRTSQYHLIPVLSSRFILGSTFESYYLTG
jgi:hypothetical protein